MSKVISAATIKLASDLEQQEALIFAIESATKQNDINKVKILSILQKQCNERIDKKFTALRGLGKAAFAHEVETAALYNAQRAKERSRGMKKVESMIVTECNLGK